MYKYIHQYFVGHTEAFKLFTKTLKNCNIYEYIYVL